MYSSSAGFSSSSTTDRAPIRSLFGSKLIQGNYRRTCGVGDLTIDHLNYATYDLTFARTDRRTHAQQASQLCETRNGSELVTRVAEMTWPTSYPTGTWLEVVSKHRQTLCAARSAGPHSNYSCTVSWMVILPYESRDAYHNCIFGFFAIAIYYYTIGYI